MGGEVSWINWGAAGIAATFSVIFFTGKANYFIAGGNAMQKPKFDPKKLGIVMGSGCVVMTILLSIAAYYNYDFPEAISWINPWGFLIVLTLMLFVANSKCRAENA